MRIFLFLSALIIFVSDISAQYNRTVVVEHFTNTVCSVCANRNPGFYDNLNAHPDVLHIAYHPSSPYSSCVLNQHNVEGNDERTNYYGVYGGTPVLVIAGEPIHVATDYSDPELFEPYANQNSNVEITIQQYKENGILYALVTLLIEEAVGGTDMWLTVPIVEKVVNYNAPNGESQHHDVFRRSGFQSGNATQINFVNPGVYLIDVNIQVDIDEAWDADQIYTMAILQHVESKEVIQASAVSPNLNIPINTGAINSLQGITIGPNPVKSQLGIQLQNTLASTAKLFSLTGQLLAIQAFSGQTSIDVNNLTPGIYMLEIRNEEGMAVEKIVVH